MEGSEVDIKRLLDDFYAILSGSIADKRDWAEFRRLFHPDARLTVLRPNSQGAMSYSVESYVARLDAVLRQDEFYERGSNYRIEVHGRIAHVHSCYEARTSEYAGEPLKKGVNLVQLMYVGSRWGIVSMLWADD